MEVIDRDGQVISSLEPSAKVVAPRTDLVVTPHPVTLAGQRVEAVALLYKETLAELLARVAPNVSSSNWVVSIGGLEVPAQMWALTRPRPGVLIACRRRVREDVVKIAAIIAISYFTFGVGGLGAGGLFTSGGLIGGGFLAAAGAFVVGTMLVNKLLAPKQPSTGSIGSNGSGTTYSISGSNNRARPYEPLGLLFGEVRVSPDFASAPFSWFSGQDQYYYEVLHGGINCSSVSDVRIGQTPISSYLDWDSQTDGFPGMAQQTLAAWSNADTVSAGRLYGGPNLGEWWQDSPGPWVTRTTSVDTCVIEVDLEGQLYYQKDDGGIAERTSWIEAQYRLLPEGGWQSFFLENFSSRSTDPLRITRNVRVPQGQYEVRIRKHTADTTGREANMFSWSYLKSIQPDTGYYAGIGRFGLKIRASGQLNGTLDTVNWLARANPLPVWNGSAWIIASTREDGLSNPGAQILLYARGIYGPDGRLQAGMGLSDDMIDIESLQGFMIRCATKGYRFDWYLDHDMSHKEVLDSIAGAGMGSISWSRGKLGVIWFQEDEPHSGVVNMATMTGGAFRVDYLTLDTADGLEYQYFDRNKDFTWTPIRVKSPNVETTLNPSKITSVGITEEVHAAVLARFHVAQSEFQRKSISFNTDLEHLTYQRGSVLMLAHDVTQWGYGGRLAGATIINGLVHLTLDDVVPPGAGGFIGLRLLGDKGYTVFQVNELYAASREVSLASAWPDSMPFPGAGGTMPHDVIWMYDFKATPGYRVRVSEVQPNSDLSGATVTCVPESPQFWNYVLNGTYEPPPNQSLLKVLPTVLKIQVTEQLIRQGNAFAVTLTLTMDYTGSFDHAEVWGSVNGGLVQRQGTTTNRRFSMTAGVTDTWQFDVRPYDGVGRRGTSAQADYTVLGLSLPPGNVPWFRSDGNALSWGTVPDVDLLGYLIRYHYGDNPSWGDAHPLHDGLLTDMPYLPPATPQGPLTLMIRAVDTSGNQSEKSAVIRSRFGDVLVANVVEVFDFKAMGYPGTLTGGAVTAESIVADNTAIFYGNDAAAFYPQYDSTPFYRNNYAAIMYETTLIAPRVVAAGSAMTLDLEFYGDAQFIEYRAIGTELMYPMPDDELFFGVDSDPFFVPAGPYSAWPGQVTATDCLYQFRFQTGHGATEGRIANCKVVIDVPDVVERFNDLSVPIAGIRLPLSKRWFEIDNVQITLQDDGGSAVLARCLDKSVQLGPLIRCFSSTGDAVSGSVDVVVQGK